MIKRITIILPLIFLSGLFSVLQAQTINDAVEQYLRGNWDLDSADCEIEVLACHIKTKSLDGLQLSFKPLTQGEPIGLFTILGELKDGETVIQRGQIRIRIKKFAEVLVSQDKIKRHAILTDAKFELKRMEITSLREQPVMEIGIDLQYRATRNLSRGQILTSRSIEQVPDIEVGREVSILFDNGSFVISVPGKALQSGRIGDIVKVKNLTSGKIIHAKVVDRSIVSIKL